MIEAMMVVLVWTANPGSVNEYRYDFPSMEDCLKSSEASMADVSDGGDAEGGAVLFCVPAFEGGSRVLMEYRKGATDAD